MDQTTPFHRNGTMLAPVVAFTMLMGVGTGGDYTFGYHALRGERLAFAKPRDDARRSAVVPIAVDIEHMRSTLNLTMTELARCLGVSRQAPYNWLSGNPIKPANLAKLHSLRAAADLIAAEGIPASPLLLNRKLSGGNSFLDMISAGVDGSEAARSLVEVYKTEAEQRQILNERFAGRQTRSRDVLLDSSAPPLTDES
jgi:transcriptional regulator with XRE-family HTH domain